MGKRWMVVSALLVVFLLLLGGCGGGSGTTNTNGTATVDTAYNFTANGVQPGVDTITPTTGRVRGLVRDANQAPVAAVTVTLYRLSAAGRAATGRAVLAPANRQAVGSASTLTGADGSYVFGAVPAGPYQVACQSQTVNVSVTAGNDSTASFGNVTSGGSTTGGTTSGGSTSGTSGGTLPAARYKWTMMIYLDGDNDLEQYGVLNVNQMEMLPDSSNVAIVVLMDRSPGFDTSNGNWTGARRFKIAHDTDTSIMTSAKSVSEGGSAEVLGNVDMGSATNVKSFISWAQNNYPADHYLLDVWDHGAGWRPTGRIVNPKTRGVLYDDTSGTYVTTPQLSQALTAAAKIDIVMFDSSLMQMAEVAYQIKDLASIVVGSEESPPGEGYPYDKIFDLAVSTPATVPETLAAHIVNATVDNLGSQFDLTQSALRAAQLPSLLTAINNYSDTLKTKVPLYPTQLANARTSSQRYGSGSNLYDGNRDLMDFVNLAATNTGDSALATGRDAVQAALTSTLIAERHSGASKANSHGLAIFIPSQSDWTSLRSAYLQTQFGIDGRWSKWIDALYGM